MKLLFKRKMEVDNNENPDSNTKKQVETENLSLPSTALIMDEDNKLKGLTDVKESSDNNMDTTEPILDDKVTTEEESKEIPSSEEIDDLELKWDDDEDDEEGAEKMCVEESDPTETVGDNEEIDDANNMFGQAIILSAVSLNEKEVNEESTLKTDAVSNIDSDNLGLGQSVDDAPIEQNVNASDNVNEETKVAGNLTDIQETDVTENESLAMDANVEKSDGVKESQADNKKSVEKLNKDETLTKEQGMDVDEQEETNTIEENSAIPLTSAEEENLLHNRTLQDQDTIELADDGIENVSTTNIDISETKQVSNADQSLEKLVSEPKIDKLATDNPTSAVNLQKDDNEEKDLATDETKITSEIDNTVNEKDTKVKGKSQIDTKVTDKSGIDTEVTEKIDLVNEENNEDQLLPIVDNADEGTKEMEGQTTGSTQADVTNKDEQIENVQDKKDQILDPDEPTPSTSQDNQPDASNEIPEMDDTLGLLAESSRMVTEQDEDQDDEFDDGDGDGDGDGDDDDDFDHDQDDESNQMTVDHSEDSNTAQNSETELTRVDTVIPIDSHDNAVDSFVEEKSVGQEEKGDGMEIIEDVKSIEKEELPAGDKIDSEPVSKDQELSMNVDLTTTDSKDNVEESTTEAQAKSDISEVKTEKSVEIETNQDKPKVSYVDLEESSSEDDIQEVNKDSSKVESGDVTTVNIPQEIDVISNCTKAGSHITTKAGELVISGIPRPQPPKVTRLNTAEISIKTTTTSDSSPLLIPEANINEEPSEPKKKFGLEVFSLDSDDEKEKQDKKEDSKQVLEESKSLKKSRRCVNPNCIQDVCTTAFYAAEPAMLRYYDVKRKKRRMICEVCMFAYQKRMEVIMDGVKSFQPILSVEMSGSNQILVEISDSSDSDEEEKESKSVIGDVDAQIIEEQLADMINDTWLKYKLAERLSETKRELDLQMEQLENDSKEINKVLKECQATTDGLRNQLYAAFAKRVRQLPALDLDEETIIRDPGSKRPRMDQNTTKTTFDNDNSEISLVKQSAESAPEGLPPVGDLVREPLKVGMQVYASRNAGNFSSWIRATVESIVPPKSGSQFTSCRLKFEAKVKCPKILPGRQLAYVEPANVRLTIGTRVIALFKDPMNTTKKQSYYAGVVAESPNPMNSYRYLIFFDYGYAQYVSHEHTRVVCECSSLVWEEVHVYSREFVRQYLMDYPERPMVRLHPGQELKTEWNGKWWNSTVTKVDASLAHVYFEADDRSEWIYRGSTRLAPLYKELRAAERHRSRALPRSTNKAAAAKNMPYVEYTRSDEMPTKTTESQQEQEMKRQRAVAKKSTTATNMAPAYTPRPNVDGDMSRVVFYSPKAAVKPLKMTPHSCSSICKRTDVLPLKELRTYNPLARPLLSGWERQIVRFRYRREVMYRAPCGRRLRNMAELHMYLQMIESEMGVDLFDFSVETHCLTEFVLNKCIVSKKDLSHGKENVPVPCVNYYDTSLPEFCLYNTERSPTAGVPLNLDPDFLCGCDCEDDCEDKSKCACWKMTLEGAKTIGMDGDIGYKYKRLLDPVPSGIYECNSRCKCKKTCLNRVAQQPLQLKLQVFKTLNRGWGIRALNDVPKGCFLCVYAGNLLTDATANLDGLNEGDEYLAELDYIEVVETMKEGYEDDIPDADKEKDKEDSEETSEEEELPEETNDDKEDEDFKPALPVQVGSSSKHLRKRGKKKDVEAKQEEKVDKEKEKERGNTEEEYITISDDEEVREPSRFMAQPDMESKEHKSKYRSVRSYFGKDEACYIMDAKVQGNIGRYLNHSCTPNVFVQNVFVDTHDPRFPWVAFFALRHIAAGSELTWNYNYDVGSVPGKMLYCYCGAPNCRGRLL